MNLSFLLSFYDSYSQLFLFAAINLMLALSIYVTLSAGLLSLGSGAFMGIGAYTSALLTKFYGWPFPVVLLAGAVIAGAGGLLLGLPVLRLRGIFLAIATIGFGEIIRIVALNWEPTGEALGLNAIPVKTEFWQVVLALVAVCYVLVRLRASRTGHALVALREDESAARTMGINTFRYKLLALTLGAVIAGLAGGFSAHQTHFIAPSDFGFATAANILVFAIVGGTGAFWGPMLGAALLTVLPESLRFLKDYRLIFNGLVLLAVIIFLPEGLMSLVRLLPGKKLAEAGSLDSVEA